MHRKYITESYKYMSFKVVAFIRFGCLSPSENKIESREGPWFFVRNLLYHFPFTFLTSLALAKGCMSAECIRMGMMVIRTGMMVRPVVADWF